MLYNLSMRDKEFDGIDDYNNQQWGNIDEPYYYLSEEELDELEAEVKQKAKERIINLLKENSKCTLDGGHDTNGYCFCEAIDLIKETANGAA